MSSGERLSGVTRIRAVGLTLSVAAAIAMIVVTKDEAIGLVTGLVCSAITFQLEMLHEIEQRREDDAEMLRIARLSAANQPLDRLLRALPAATPVMRKDVFFDHVIRRQLNEVANNLHDVGRGKLKGRVHPDDLVAFINSAKDHIRATSIAEVEVDFWANRADGYRSANFHAHARGVVVERVFIFDGPNASIEREMQRQADEGLKVFRVERRALHGSELRFLLIRDDDVIQHIQLGVDQAAGEYRYYRDTEEVVDGIAIFRSICRKATPVPERQPSLANP